MLLLEKNKDLGITFLYLFPFVLLEQLLWYD